MTIRRMPPTAAARARNPRMSATPRASSASAKNHPNPVAFGITTDFRNPLQNGQALPAAISRADWTNPP